VNVDVLAIGCGPAGASAAIAVHDAGASVLVVEKRRCGGGNALFAGGFLWDVRGPEAVRHVQTLFFGKTDPSVAQAYVAGLNDLRSWIIKLGGDAVGVDPPPGSFPAVLPSWPHVPGSDGVRYWVVGVQPSLRRGEALWQHDPGGYGYASDVAGEPALSGEPDGPARKSRSAAKRDGRPGGPV
jgi:hypothetical protein